MLGSPTSLRKPLAFAIVAATSTGLVLTYKVVPSLFPNHIYRPIFEAFRAGKYCALTETQQSEFQQVCHDLNVDSKRYVAFVTSRWQVKSVGLPWLPAKCHIGVPSTMVPDPDVSSVRFSGPIKANLDTREGLWVRDSLQLGPNARKFAVAQQVALSEANSPLYSMVMAPCCTLASFATTFVVQVFSPLLPVYATGLAVGACFFFTYRFIMGAVNEKIDLKCNERVANISDEYTMGGLEFYEKMLQRNRGLRKLLGKKGEQLYTYYGNEASGIVYSAGATNIQKRDILKRMFQEREETRKACEQTVS